MQSGPAEQDLLASVNDLPATRLLGLPPPPSIVVEPPRVPGYRVEHEIGRGGMGVVYRGTNIRLNRPVALKLMHGSFLADPRATQRFVFEAEVLARVSHPRVVRVFEAGTCDRSGAATPYLAMELLDGGTLRDAIRTGTVSIAESAELVEGLARAAHAAHVQGIVHRDIKPANILRNPGGEFKLADFGLAKQTTGPAAALTNPGIVVGTPQYMSPEQATGDGHEVGPAADVYALGAVLYELLTGRPPFLPGDPVHVLLKVVHEPPSEVRSIAPATPPDLAAVVMKCLSKDPRRRYPTAEALADDLARVQHGRPTLARPLRRRERAWRWVQRNPVVSLLSVLLAGTVFAALVGTSWLYIQAEESATIATLARIEAEKNAKIALAERAEADRTGAYLEFEQGVTLCEQGRPNQGIELFLSALEKAERGGDTELAQIVRVNLKNWGAALFPAGTSVQYDRVRECLALAYSPNGKWLALAGRGGEIQVLDADTGKHLVCLKRPRPPLAEAVTSTVLALTPRWNMPDKWCVDVADHAWDVLNYLAADQIWSVAFDPSGDKICVGDCRGSVREWTWRNPDRPAREFRPPILFTPDTDIWALAYAPDGTVWFSDPTDRALVQWNPTTGETVRRLAVKGRINGVRLQPRIVTCLLLTRDGQRVFTGDRGGHVVEWSVGEGRPTAAWQCSNRVTDFCAAPQSPPPSLFAMCSTGHVMELSYVPPDAPPGVRATALPVKSGSPRTPGQVMDLDPSSRVLVTADVDGNVELFDTFIGQPLGSPLHANGHVRQIQFRPGTRQFAVASGNGARIQALDWPPAVPLPLPTREPVRAVAARPGDDGDAGEAIVCAGQAFGVFNAASGQAIHRGQTPKRLTSAHLHPDSRRLLRGYHAGWDLFDLTTREVLASHTLANHEHCDGFAIRPGTHEIFVNLGERIHVHAADGQGPPLRTLDPRLHGLLGPGSAIRAILFSPTGDELLLAHADRIDRLDPETGQSTGPAIPTGEAIVSVAISADGSRLVTGHRDNTARLWDRVQGTPLFDRPVDHALAVSAVAIRADGLVIVTGCRDGTAQAWDCATRLPLGPKKRHSESVTTLCWGASPRHIIVGTSDGSAATWRVETEPATGSVEELRARFTHSRFSPGAATIKPD